MFSLTANITAIAIQTPNMLNPTQGYLIKQYKKSKSKNQIVLKFVSADNRGALLRDVLQFFPLKAVRRERLFAEPRTLNLSAPIKELFPYPFGERLPP